MPQRKKGGTILTSDHIAFQPNPLNSKVLCIKNIFGNDTPEEVTEFLKQYNDSKDNYRFEFFLNDLNWETEELEEKLYYRYYDLELTQRPGSSIVEYINTRKYALFFENKEAEDYPTEHLLLTYLKPLIEKLKQLEKQLENITFTNILFTFMIINDTRIQKGSVDDFHVDTPTDSSLAARQFAILLTEHPQTDFHKNNTYIRCPQTNANSASYWNNLVLHRRPSYDTNNYHTKRSIVSIIMNLNSSRKKEELDSEQHFEKERKAFQAVFGNIFHPVAPLQKSLPKLKRKLNQGGSKQTVSYQGIRYKVHIGKRGGKYIMVNDHKKYISK